MKKFTTMLTAISFVCLLSIGIVANDTDLKESVTFTQQVWVNNTLVEPGKYSIHYDAATGMMKVMQGDNVVAQAKATVTVNEEKFAQDAVLLNTTDKGQVLTGIRLGGQREELHLSEIVAESDSYNFNFHKY